MTENQHIGKLHVAVDIGMPCSPGLRCYLPPDTDVAALIDQANAEMEAVIARLFPNAERIDLPSERPVVHLTFPAKIVRSAAEEQAERDAALEDLRGSYQIAREIKDAAIDNNPHNGKLGWWRVDGIRHQALVRASSEREAIEKAGDVVQSWEEPGGEWIGEELPEVVEI